MTKAEECHNRSPQLFGLAQASAIGARAPIAFAQGCVLDGEVAPERNEDGGHVFGNRSFIVEGVRAHSPRVEGLRLDAVEAGPGGMNQPESGWPLLPLPWSGAVRRNIGVPERGQHAGITPESVPGDDRSQSKPPFKDEAVHDEVGVGDDDFHSVISCSS
jgi:hypothetical protein